MGKAKFLPNSIPNAEQQAQQQHSIFTNSAKKARVEVSPTMQHRSSLQTSSAVSPCCFSSSRRLFSGVDATDGSSTYDDDAQKCQMGSNTFVSKVNQATAQWWKKRPQRSNSSVIAHSKNATMSEASLSSNANYSERKSSLHCHVCIKPHLSDRSLAKCTFCERLSCRSDGCIRQCEMCEQPYCVFCSATNYDGTFERTFCLDCDRQVKNAMNIG